MRIEVREVKTQDISQIKEFLPQMWFMHADNSDLVDQESLKKVQAKKYVEEIIKNKDQTAFVAETQDKIIGFISCEIKSCPSFYKEKYELYVDDLIVLKEYRNKGIATKLIQITLDFAHSNRIKLVTAKIWDFNKESASLFEKCKFKRDYSFHSLSLK